MEKVNYVEDLDDFGDAFEELKMNKIGEKEHTEVYRQVSRFTMRLMSNMDLFYNKFLFKFYITEF